MRKCAANIHVVTVAKHINVLACLIAFACNKLRVLRLAVASRRGDAGTSAFTIPRLPIYSEVEASEKLRSDAFFPPNGYVDSVKVHFKGQRST